MTKLVTVLYPYCLRHRWMYLWGALAVLASNFLYVRSFVWTGRGVDFILSPSATMAGVWRYIGVISAIVGAGAVGQYFQRILLIGASRVVEYEMRNDFFKHLTRLSPGFYDRIRTGDIIARATSDMDQIRMALGPGIMYPLTTVSVVPVTLWAMAMSSWPVTLYSFIPMLGLPVLVNVLANKMYQRSLRTQEHFSDFSGRIQESITGIRVIKSFVQSRSEIGTLDEANEKYAALNMALARIQAAFHPILMTLFLLGIVVIIWVSSRFVTDDPALLAKRSSGMMTKGELIAFVMLYRNLFFPVLGLGWVTSVYQRASASMHRILLIWHQEPAIKDAEETDVSLQDIRGEIEFRNLTFTFPKSDRPSLRGVSLKIPAGKSLGIVGPVGSGKSSIAQIVSRLYEAPPGRVFIDGRDVREYPLDVLRRSVGMVFQETYLFSDTIAANICFGLGREEDEEKAEAAARVASMDGDIQEFPDKYRTRLGERGINLSGGQKQRVALARALVCDPPILILDDAFASVDTHTEERILQELRSVMRERTTILVSHRTSTVREADEIIVLDDGEIVERGTHDELVERGGLYAEIHRRQQLAEAIEEEV